jgi:hypothetical protein
MAVGANDAQVLEPIVGVVAVDVVELEPDGLPSPFGDAADPQLPSVCVTELGRGSTHAVTQTQ